MPEISLTADPQVTRRVWLLGGLRVAGAHGDIQIAAGKLRSLFTLLVLRPALAQAREALADTLWPDAPPERARHNLANALYGLRQALGPEWLHVQSDRVALRGGPDLWVDAWAFERWCADDDPAAVEQAVAIYAGELLPELYDDWIVPDREGLRERYLAALARLAESAEQQRRFDLAAAYYDRLRDADPLREDAAHGLMRTLARQGRPAEALAAYARLEAALAADLGLRPAAELADLAEQMRREIELSRDGAPAARRPAPFVGRVEERAQLLARLERANGGKGGVVVVLGEVGSGKTRLLEELSRAAGWRGWQIAWGHGQEFALPAPYTPLGQALAAALPPPRLQQIVRRIQPIWLAMIAGLVPHAAGAGPGWQHISQDQRRLPIAIRHVLGGLQQIAPHLLLLDDLQWADPDVWPLLAALRQPLDDMAILLLVSGRTEELRAQPQAWSTLQSWDAAGVPVFHLSGLSASELAELAAAHAASALSSAQLAQLHTASGGNPLLALALLQSGGLDRLLDQPSLGSLMRRRLEALSPQTHLALEAAAVLSYRFSYRPWEAVAGEAHSAALPALAIELERARLILPDSDGYRFAHDTLRAYVYAQTPPERRHWLHQRALAALEAETPEDTLALLYHAEQADDTAATGRYALAAGKQSLASCSFQTAVRFFSQALDALPPDDLPQRYLAVRGRLRAFDILADRAAQQRDLELLKELADRLGDRARRAEIAQQQAEFFWATGVWDRAYVQAELALALAREHGDVRRQARAIEMLSQVVQNRGNHAQARAWLVEAQALYRSVGDPFGEATTTHNLGIVVWALGDHQAAIEQYAASVGMFHDLGELFREARALNSLGCALWGVGEYVQARDTHERALAISRDLGDRWGEDANILNLGHVALMLGDYVSAIDCFDTALASFRASNNTLGISVGLSNLGAAYRLLGDGATALDYCGQALAISQAMGHRRVEGYVQHNRGLALLAGERAGEARQALEQARAIRAELGEHDNLLESQAGLALALLIAGATDQAGSAIDAALEVLELRRERAALRQWVEYAAYRVRLAQGKSDLALRHIRQAETAMFETAKLLPSDERAGFLQNVELNRETQAALRALIKQVHVRLVRADVPLGRKLSDDDYRSVVWTVYAPEDDAIGRMDQRRQHVLRRLLAEAQAQGAAPTDDDLATALRVSRRTVLRDMRLLAAAGQQPATRRRGDRGLE